MIEHIPRITLVPALALISIAMIIISCFSGAVPLSPSAILAALFGNGAPEIQTIVREIRLPRSLAAWCAGAALGASGAALQGLLRNPLADPGVLGISSTAALGAVIVLYFNIAALGFWIVPVAAIIGALAATVLLYILGAMHVSTTRLILIGVGLSSFTGAMITLVMNLAPNPFALADLINWLFGTVAHRSMRDLVLITPFMGAGIALLIAGQRHLSALTLGEETALTLGVDLNRTRAMMITGSALLTGASVAIAGAIGFVGIIAPHLMRPLVGHDPGRTIIPAALLAGIILVLTDMIIRLLPFNQELKLGVVAALIGAPAFVWIAARSTRLAP